MRVVSAVLFSSVVCLGLAACGTGTVDPGTKCFFEVDHAVPEGVKSEAGKKAFTDCVERHNSAVAAKRGNTVVRTDHADGSISYSEKPISALNPAVDPTAKAKTGIPTINTNGTASSGSVAPAQPATTQPVPVRSAATGNGLTGAAIAGDGKSCNRTMTGGTGYGCMPN